MKDVTMSPAPGRAQYTPVPTRPAPPDRFRPSRRVRAEDVRSASGNNGRSPNHERGFVSDEGLD